jgi:hypothetical protein
MSETKKDGMDRRKFLRGAIATTAIGLGWGCLNLSEEALADIKTKVQKTGKPLLTDEALNKLIADAQQKNPRLAEQYAREAKSNLAAFCRKYFTVAKEQEAFFKALNAKQKAEIARGIDFSVRRKTPFQTRITVSKAMKTEFKVDVKTDTGTGGTTASASLSISC